MCSVSSLKALSEYTVYNLKYIYNRASSKYLEIVQDRSKSEVFLFFSLYTQQLPHRVIYGHTLFSPKSDIPERVIGHGSQ